MSRPAAEGKEQRQTRGNLPKCLLVLPHYRHVEQLRAYLPDLLTTLPASFDILVSDDGSPSPDRRQLSKLVEDARLQWGASSSQPALREPIFAATNQGKGSAIYAGWRSARDEKYLAFADCDGATPASEILRGYEHLVENCAPTDVLIGSRIKVQGRTVSRRLSRHCAGRIFAIIVSLVTRLPVYDTQCGFKIVPRSGFEAVRPYLRCGRSAFDVELLLFLQRAGCRLVEFPIDWRDVPGGSITVFGHAIPMLGEVLAARRNAASARPPPE